MAGTRRRKQSHLCQYLVNYPKSLNAELNYLHTEYAMKDAVFLPERDIKGIKQAIIKNGSVSASYEATSDSYNKQYFYTGSDKSNHSITIVGYDDRILYQGSCLEKRSRKVMVRGF